MTSDRVDADVAIIGAGPVGLTLAIDLAARGRSVVVLETRARGEPPNVKCNHVAARTMEQFRRLGVAADVRGAGLPPDYPNDVAFRTSVTGVELSPTTSAEFGRFIASETVKWADVIKRSGTKLE